MITREPLSFDSQGARCAATLYRPEAGARSLPCVVMANGFSGTRDWVLPDYAERFAAAGMAALAFDYRHLGESEGKPRQLISVKRQRQDLKAAIAFARSHPLINADRIVLWGTSLGGGHVIDAAAQDDRLAAVVAQVPGIDMVRREARATIPIPTRTIAKLILAALWDGLRGALGLSPFYAKVFGKPGELAIFTDPHLRPRFEAVMEGAQNWRNAFTPRFYLAPPRYRDGTAERIRMPVLVCIAEGEVYANPAFQAEIGRKIPRGEVKAYPGEHFDFYHGLLEEVVRDQIAFLEKHLGMGSA